MLLTNIRYIVPGVENLRVKASGGGFQRHAPKLDYAKARQRWWIKLRFNSDIDLMILEKTVSGSEIRLVELEEKFYLEDQRIPDTADMSEAYHSAEFLLAQLNGATQLLCPPFIGAQLECMVELLENGTGRDIPAVNVTVHGSLEYPGIRSFLDNGLAPISPMLPVWKSDRDVQDALFYLGSDGNVWANLYKACEIVEDRVGGNSKDIFQNNWCSRSEWERFRRTANHQEAIGLFSRHARQRTVPPPDPMTVDDARAFAVGLVNKWIASMIKRDAMPDTPEK